MEIKILQVFYGKDGLPYKDKDRQVHFPIAGTGFLGASNTTQIKFYYDELDNLDETTWVAVSKLPNGKLGSRVLESYLDSDLNEHYALLELDNYYTQYKGDVFISLQGYQGGVQIDFDEETQLYTINGTPTIAATGSVKFTINYANQFVGSGQADNVTLQRILADLGTKLGIRARSEHVDELPTVGESDVFYVINNDLSDPNKQNIYIWNAISEHYVWVGDNSLDLGEYYTKEQGDQFEEQTNVKLIAMQNEIAGFNQLRPSGVDTSANILSFTEDKGIWVGSDTGNWYYWNGTQYVSGGVYMATPIGINEIELEQLKLDIANNFLSINLFDKNQIVDGGRFNSDGSIQVDASSQYNKQYIIVDGGSTYKFNYEGTGSTIYSIATYDKQGTFLARVNCGYGNPLVTFSSNVRYIRISTYQFQFNEQFMFCKQELFPSSFVAYNLSLNGNKILNKSITKDKFAGMITDYLAKLTHLVTEKIDVVLITLGGETSYKCCKAINSNELKLVDEVAPAISICYDINHKWIITKSGNLGNSNTLIEILNYLGRHE